jgi:predicted AAA+ superfamily ATPase
MNYKERLLSRRITSQLSHFPVVIINGARQVGKSTMLEHLFPNVEHIVFDSVVDVGNAREDPELFLRNRDHPLILDEIPYVPELVPSIKRQVDKRKKKGLYILTGSQQWSVMKTASESLAGRASFVD